MWECNCATLSIWSSKDAPLGCSVVQEAFQESSARHMSSHPLITYLHTPVNTIFITYWAYSFNTFIRGLQLMNKVFQWHEERKKMVRVNHCNPCWTEHRPGWKLLLNVHRADYPFIYCSVTPSAGQSLLLFVFPIKLQNPSGLWEQRCFCRLYLYFFFIVPTKILHHHAFAGATTRHFLSLSTVKRSQIKWISNKITLYVELNSLFLLPSISKCCAWNISANQTKADLVLFGLFFIVFSFNHVSWLPFPFEEFDYPPAANLFWVTSGFWQGLFG